MIRLETQEVTISIGAETICRSLNLTVRAGEIWGILGPNGSGKTTLLHTLAGLHPVLRGQLFLHEPNLKIHNLKNLTPKLIAQSIALLFQNFTDAFPQTVEEYCQTGRYPHRTHFAKERVRDLEIVTQALLAMDLHLFRQRCITKLSGGEKRRLALACVLAQTPTIYLLDEPTNQLDVRHQIRVLNHFRHLVTTESATIVMSLHDINLAQRFCTHILLLFPNGYTVQGRMQDILTASNLSSLYQHKMNAAHSSSGVYWQPESDITLLSS